MAVPRLAFLPFFFAITIATLAACGSNGGNGTVVSPTPAGGAVPTETPSGVCASPIPPLTTGPVTKPRFDAALQKMAEVERAAEAGDAAGARAAFAGDTHAVTHDIDEPLRAVDPLLAWDLCESILFLEQEFNGEGHLPTIAGEAAISIDLLEDSGRALDLIE